MMLGKLGWDAIPFDQPIPLIAGGTVVLLFIAVIAFAIRILLYLLTTRSRRAARSKFLSCVFANPGEDGRGGGIRTPKFGFGDRQFNR